MLVFRIIKICPRFEHMHVLDDSSMLTIITDYNYIYHLLSVHPFILSCRRITGRCLNPHKVPLIHNQTIINNFVRLQTTLYFPPQLCPLHVVRITVHHMYDQVLSHDFRYNNVPHFDVGSEEIPNIQHEIFYS